MNHHQAGVICGFMLGTVVGASSRPALGQPDDLRDHATDSQKLLHSAALRPAGLASSSAQTDPAATPREPSTKPVVRASAQRAEQATLVFTKSVEMKYLLYLPQEYDGQPEKKWPLLMHLHGVGERGDDLEKVKTHGPARYIAEGKDYPFVIVTPQCPADQWWDPDALLALLDTVTRSLRIDPDRVYLTGLSMGGYGTWCTAARDPKRFAAIAPICGGGNVADAPKLVNLAIWAFHGEKDTVVPPERSKEMVDAVNQAGGRARLTLYPDAAHDSWTRTYENPELYKWFLSHRRGQPPVFGVAD